MVADSIFVEISFRFDLDNVKPWAAKVLTLVFILFADHCIYIYIYNEALVSGARSGICTRHILLSPIVGDRKLPQAGKD